MRSVAIISGTGNLNNYLKGIAKSANKGNKYLLLGAANDKEERLLEHMEISRVPWQEVDDDFTVRFLREYRDLIGTLGKTCDSRVWWATNIASKNRFTSKLPLFLHQFYTAIENIKSEKYDHLIILNPPWIIVSSLTRVLSEQKLDFVCHLKRREKTLDIVAGWTKSILLLIYIVIKTTWNMLYAKKKLRKYIKKRIDRAASYYVIKTFIYDHSFPGTGSYRDAFFGSLPDFLNNKGKRVLIYAVIAGNYRHCIQKIKKCDSQIILPLEGLLSLSDILQAAYQALFTKIRITKNAPFFGYDVKDIIKSELIRTFNGIPCYQFLHYWSTRNLFTMLTVEKLLLTYENNPWEKMCLMAVKEYSPMTKTIGYQHTVVPQASTNMFVSREEREIAPMPDKILTVGNAPKDIMERYGHYEQGKIEPACGLRFEYLFDILPSKRGRSNTILLALDGIYDVYKMINYAFKELKDSPFAVIIRTHPVLPLEKMRRDIPKELWLNSNFQLSKQNSLKHDIESSDIVMYWGSTVALEALSMGKPVIHFETGSVLSYDPLFECNYLKWKVSKQDPLIEKINEIYALSEDEFYSQQEKARAYLKNYFYPVTDESLMRFIEEDKLHAGINIA